MPISVGEVNATLRFTILATEISQTQAKLRDLSEEFLAASNASGQLTARQQQLELQMKPLTERLIQMKTESASTRVELNKFEEVRGFRQLKEEADGANQSFDQMQMLALRMAERLAILFAVRELYTFVKGVYDAADAMVQLSDRSGMTLEYIQELTTVGAEVGEDFKTLAGQADHLNKTLSEFKGGDALHELGISFEEIFSLDPDARMELIAMKIAAIASPTERAKIETQLFGTDGIDPLLRKLAQLGPALKDATAPLDEGYIRSLAQVKGGYEGIGVSLESFGEHLLKWGSDVGKTMFDPAVVLFMGGFQGLRDAAANGILFSDSLDGLSKAAERAANSSKNLPIEGQAFIDSLKQQIPLTTQQKEALDQLNEIHELTYQNAARATAHNQVTEAQFKAYTASLREATEAERAHEAELRKDSTLYEHYTQVIDEVLSAGKNWKDTVAQITDQYKSHSATIVESINGVVTFASVTTDATSKVVDEAKELLNAGVAQKTVAEWTGLTATQVRALVEELKSEDAARKLVLRTTEEQEKVNAKLHELIQNDEASDLEKHINVNNRKYEDDVANARKRGIVDQSYYDALDALRRKSNELDEKRLSDETAFSRVHYETLYKDAQNAYDAVLAYASDHTPKEIALFKQKRDAALATYRDWKDAAVADLSQVDSTFSSGVQDFDNGLKFMGQGLDDTKVKVRLLDDEVVTLKEAMDRFNAGNTITYDLTTRAGVEKYRQMNTAATISLSDAQIIAMVSAGATLQSLIEQGYIHPYGRFSITTDHGILPHAADGGLVKVGEHGTEIVHLPDGAAVFPSGSSPSGGVTLYQTFHVNGTGEQVYNDIRKRMIQDVRSFRLLGTV